MGKKYLPEVAFFLLLVDHFLKKCLKLIKKREVSYWQVFSGMRYLSTQ